MSKKTPTPATSPEVALSKHQTFTMARMDRGAIKEHPKNPRLIDATAKKRLKDKIGQAGLMQPLVVNKRTGHLLSGHQRMASLDALEGNQNYALDVSVVDVDEKTELEMLVFFNNPSAQGSWDLDTLADLNVNDGMDFQDAGFDPLEVEMLFVGDDRFAHSIHDDSTEVKQAKDELTGMKERRAKGAAKMAARNNTDFYFTVVCRDAEELENLLDSFNMPPGTMAIAAERLVAEIESIIEEALEEALNPTAPSEGEEAPAVELVDEAASAA